MPGQRTKERELAAVKTARDSLAQAEHVLWDHASSAREAGATLAEVANAAGVAIETVRRRLGETTV